MASFVGYVELEESGIFPLLARDNQLQPVAADAEPTFRVYSSAGYLGVSGTATALDIDGLYSYTVPCLSSSGFVAGSMYFALLSWTVGGVPAATLETFIVN